MENLSIESEEYQNTKREAREYYAKIDRVWCLQLASFIIFNRAGFQRVCIFYERKIFENGEAEFWIFKHAINKIMVTVVLRRIGSGSIHFFSVY